MFTGIIEATATVGSLENARLVLKKPAAFDAVTIGQSIAVQGVCLTVVAFDDISMAFDVADTTLQRTTLGTLETGQRVNLERAMRIDGRLDGHIVQGHVDNIGTIVDLTASDHEHRLSIRVPSDLLPYVVKRGSITIDGVSLTVADIENDVITIALVPHTFAVTTLGDRSPDDTVNIETDIVGRYIASLASHGR